VYSDESAAVDLTVTVEGEEYQAEVVVDLDGDGVEDSAMVETDDGAIAFTDTDDDGRADLMTQLDADGDIVAQARFDESTGEWVQVDIEQVNDTGPMTADTPLGQIEVGAPTHDTDHDGKADSVVVHTPGGGIVIFTDADEDGDADYVTEITDDGKVTVAEHTSDGDWVEIERGELEVDGDDQRGSQHTESGTIAEESSWSATNRPDPAEVRIDPSTGDWVRG
jgi:uncharacterized protein DUF6802